MITPEEFESWKHHPITEKMFSILKNERIHHVENLLSQIGSISDANLLSLGTTGGFVKAIDLLIQMDRKGINSYLETEEIHP